MDACLLALLFKRRCWCCPFGDASCRARATACRAALHTLERLAVLALCSLPAELLVDRRRH
jgi:hypothetical protein